MVERLAGQLNVSLASGLALDLNDLFLMINIAGARSGQFAGLDEGDLVCNFGGRDLFITYAAGEGNDVALFTGTTDFTADFNADFLAWQQQLGSGAPADGVSHAVPEPGAAALALLAALAARTMFGRRRR